MSHNHSSPKEQKQHLCVAQPKKMNVCKAKENNGEKSETSMNRTSDINKKTFR